MATLQRSLCILDVGHGNSAVLMDDQGVVVIDAGPGSALLEFLKQEGIENIDVLLISHADSDHIAGVIGLLGSEEFTIGRVRLNSDAIKTSELWDDLVYTLDKAHRANEVDFDVSLTVRDTGAFDQGSVHIEILAPDLYIAAKGPGGTDREGRRLTTNSVSAVIRLVKDGRPLVLLPGDIDDIGLENLLQNSSDLVAPIMVFPHHGGRPGRGDIGAFARRLCQLVKPQTVLFSIGRGQHGTPNPDIVDAVRSEVPKVRIACTQLSTHCSIDKPGVVAEHLTDKFAHGRQHRKCCAGTLVIYLGEHQFTLFPQAGLHQDFISLSAPTALCRRVIIDKRS